MDNYLSQWFKRRPRGDEQEPPDAPPGQRSNLGSPAIKGTAREPAGYQRSDRTDMRQLIDATRR